MVPELPTSSGGAPAAAHLAEHFRRAIARGRYRAGERLPTIRAVAADAGLPRSTVQEAYRRLAEDGLVEATVGRGTLVTPLAAAQAAGREAGLPTSPAAAATLGQLRAASRRPLLPAGQELVAHFGDMIPDSTRFPVEAFGEALQRTLAEAGAEVLGYGAPGGNLELRALLARRGPGDTPGDPDDVLVTSGAQQGLDLVMRAFSSPGDAIAVAVPTYHNLFGLIEAHGLDLIPIASGADGLDLAALERALERPDLRLLYVMPTFQNPTGHSLDRGQREALLARLAGTRVVVLEDEFERELRFAGDQPPSLRALDARGLTVTAHTFSKGLFPGIRIGWLRATPELLEPVAALKRYVDLETSPVLQAAMVEFLRSGAVDDYLQRLREELRQRHAAAQAALARAMPAGTTWSRPEGGFAVWLELPASIDADAFATAAAAAGVLVTPGRVFDPQDRPGHTLRLSLSRTPVDRVEAGIARLGELAARFVAREDHGASTPIFH